MSDRVSVIIPVYNEADYIRDYGDFLKSKGL